MMKINPDIFRSYDVRGIYPTDINEETVFLIAKAYVKRFNVKKVVVAGDVRTSTPSLKSSMTKGLLEAGASVIDIGIVTTDMMLFSVGHLETDGGIIISASHNPREYNGMKIVLKGAMPVSSVNKLFELRDMLIDGNDLETGLPPGKTEFLNIIPAYVSHVRNFIDFSSLKSFNIVANPSFGMAGVVVQEVLKGAPIIFHFLNEIPNGEFPKGPPNPLLPENQGETSQLVRNLKANLGVAWDGDADRCFFFDENGEFIPPYYMSALFSEIFLSGSKPGNNKKILHDTRLTWVIEDTVKKNGGIPIMSKAGYTFIKERMRKEEIVFGSETSGHYFFRENYYSDNGMIPFLLMLEEMSITDKKPSELIAPFKAGSFISGEINFETTDVKNLVKKVTDFYRNQDGVMLDVDGVSFEFDDWRFNIRGAANEPLIRLNIESRDKKILEDKISEITKLLS